MSFAEINTVDAVLCCAQYHVCSAILVITDCFVHQ